MKHLLTTLLLAAAAASPAFAAEDHKPMHGGVVVETKAGDMELVAKSDLIVIHVSDHGKAMKLSSATGTVSSRVWSRMRIATVTCGASFAPLTLIDFRLMKGNCAASSSAAPSMFCLVPCFASSFTFRGNSAPSIARAVSSSTISSFTGTTMLKPERSQLL